MQAFCHGGTHYGRELVSGSGREVRQSRQVCRPADTMTSFEGHVFDLHHPTPLAWSTRDSNMFP